MLILYLTLVLSTIALLGVALAIYFRVRRHMRRAGARYAAAKSTATGMGFSSRGEPRPKA